jgi:hypothetical protein
MAADGEVVFERKEVSVMPRFDGTGPVGWGPMTGWGHGYCNAAGPARGTVLARGTGYGRGFGRGRGRAFRAGFGRGIDWSAAYPAGGKWYGPAYNSPYERSYAMNLEDEVNMLKGEADTLRGELEAIEKRIEELNSKSG